jgi:hypothetical protein
MTQEPETRRCTCPEVRLYEAERTALASSLLFDGVVPEWLPICDHRSCIGVLPPDSWSPEPLDWRCPTCHGGIIRVGVASGDEPDEDYLRADFRCVSSTCGSTGYAITTPEEGVVASAE